MINQVFNAVGTGLDKLMNLVPLPGRVTILPVKRYDPVPIPSGLPFVAMFNPEMWEQNKSYGYTEEQEKGTEKTIKKFQYSKSTELNFELLLDGTGASGEKREVTQQIHSLRKAVGYNGDAHRPNKLFVIWGYFIFKGVVESMNISYTLFRANGTPLRAKVSLKFVEDVEAVSRIMEADNHSADLTHVRTAHEGQRLDQLCEAIYEQPRLHLEVAKANGLTTFRQSLTGRTIEFPPIEK